MDPKLTKEDINARMDLADLPPNVVQQIFALSEGEFIRAPRAHHRLDHKAFALLVTVALLQAPMALFLRGQLTFSVLVLAFVTIGFGSLTAILATVAIGVGSIPNLGARTIFAENILNHIQSEKVANPYQAVADYQRFITLQYWEIIQKSRLAQVKKAAVYAWAWRLFLVRLVLQVVLAGVYFFT